MRVLKSMKHFELDSHRLMYMYFIGMRLGWEQISHFPSNSQFFAFLWKSQKKLLAVSQLQLPREGETCSRLSLVLGNFQLSSYKRAWRTFRNILRPSVESETTIRMRYCFSKNWHGRGHNLNLLTQVSVSICHFGHIVFSGHRLVS